MKFDAKMARDVADCYNDAYSNYNMIPILFDYARKGRYNYSTTEDYFGKFKFDAIIKQQKMLEDLGFKVKIDEDMKVAIISW